MIRVVILGIGNVGTHLYCALQNYEAVEVIQLFNRSMDALSPFKNEIATTTSYSEIKDADIYIIATKDDTIEAVSAQIPYTNKLVVHTSGSISIDVLSSKNNKGSFYPLQTFSKNREVDFSTIPIGIEAENKKDEALLEKLAGALSQKVYKINSTQRKSLHLAAVFVNNFTNHLVQVGTELCEDNQLNFQLLLPLLKETVSKLDILSAIEAQTGPAKRNDIGTITAHLNQLKNKNHKAIYSVISESILKTYGEKL